MSYEFTKLSDVPVVDEFPEGANAIIETNGEIKRCSSGGGVQPDWNQNDDTQPDYVKNRPFYTGDTAETVFVEESTVSFTDSGYGGVYAGQLELTASAAIGDTYKVSWDGTTYECAGVDSDGDLAIGNLSITGAGSDTGEPFIMIVNNGRGIGIGTKDTSASHTISINRIVTSVVKIDEKYLPDTVATKSEVNNAQTTADTAQTTAENAQTAADNAQRTADSAEITANNAKFTADNAKATADAALPKRGGEVSGVIKSSSEIEFPRKYDSTATSIDGLRISSDIVSKVLTNRLRSYGVDITSSSYIETIVTYLDGIIIYNPNTFANGKTVSIAANGELLAFLSEIGQKPITISAKDIILQSSTANSAKKFKITVDDSGTISATEVT